MLHTRGSNYREALWKRGVHNSNKAGIAGGFDGATSVVLSGEYGDDIDKGDVVYVYQPLNHYDWNRIPVYFV